MSEPGFDVHQIPIDDPVALGEIMRGVDCLLLDFDGPICSVFAGYPAPKVAAEMRAKLLAQNLTLSEDGCNTDDPMEVLRDAASESSSGQMLAEQLLEAAENLCVDTAEPTPGASDLLRAADLTGLPVVIVSNNGATAIRRYLASRGLSRLVREVVGRDAQDASLMKPHPHLLQNAMNAANVLPSRAAFVGDSVSDIDAARAAGVIAIAYANKAQKEPALMAATPDALLRHLEWLTSTVESLAG